MIQILCELAEQEEYLLPIMPPEELSYAALLLELMLPSSLPAGLIPDEI